jgi:ankyrin repeat protein
MGLTISCASPSEEKVENLETQFTDIVQISGKEQEMFDAVLKNDVLKVVELVDVTKVDVNCVNPSGETPLTVASALGRCRIVRFLVDRGSNINTRTGIYKTTALTKASENGHKEVVRILLESKSDPNRKSITGGSALFSASICRQDEICQLLLDSGANVDGFCSRTTLMIASANGSLELVKTLVHLGSGVGMTALMFASKNGHEKVVLHLLENGANPNEVCHNGFSPLCLAVYQGNKQVVDVWSECKLFERSSCNSYYDGGSSWKLEVGSITYYVWC